MNHVTSIVSKLLNFKSARGLNHRQSIPLLQDLDAEHAGVPYNSSILWHSLGKVLKSACDLQEEIIMLLDMKDIELMFSCLEEKSGKLRLDFPDGCDGTPKQRKCDFSGKRPIQWYRLSKQNFFLLKTS
jgi:hypothetical protein